METELSCFCDDTFIDITLSIDSITKLLSDARVRFDPTKRLFELCDSL